MRTQVQATDFLDKNGDSMMSSGKFKNDFLDLGNIKLNGQTGDITMTGGITMDGNISLGGNINFGSAGSITWGKNAPVKYQFAVSATGSWHNPAQSADKYRRDSLDGGITWGAGYQFVGTDGRPGSDANVPGYVNINGLDFTSMTDSYIKSPRIFTNWLSVLPKNFQGILSDQITKNGITYYEGMRLFGAFMGGAYEYLTITPYDTGGAPEVNFWSYQGANARWTFNKTTFTGNIDFSNADVVGIEARFG